MRPLEVLSNRHNPHIDPTLDVWEWQIPAYLFLGGIVAGLMVLGALLELRRGRRPTSGAAQHMPLVAAVLLSLGMLFLFLDLANKEHVLRFYLAFRPSSPMSWGSWILLAVYPVLVLAWLSGLDDTRRERLLAWRVVTALRLPKLLTWVTTFAARHRRRVVWAMLVLGLGLGVYTGLLLGTMASRPTWNSALMGPLFLVSGISTGAAVMLLGRLDADESHLLVRWDVAAILVELTLLGVLLLAMSTGGAASSAAASAFLGGPYTAVFWAVVVVAGLLVPLALGVFEVRHKTTLTLFAPVFVLAGGLALRAVMVAAGQATGIGG